MNSVVSLVLAITVLLLAAPLVSAQDPNYVFSHEHAVIGPGGTVTVANTIDTTAGDELRYLQYGMCHDTSELILDDVIPGLDACCFDTTGYSINTYEGGYTSYALMNVITGAVIPPDVYEDFHIATYTAVDGFTGVSELEYCDTLATPTVPITVGGDAGDDIIPTTINGSIEVFASNPFIRGDVDEDGEVDAVDALTLLEHLFIAQPAPNCLDSAEINGDGQLDVGDAISLITYLFGAGIAPAAPFPDCGIPDGDDESQCESYGGCE